MLGWRKSPLLRPPAFSRIGIEKAAFKIVNPPIKQDSRTDDLNDGEEVFTVSNTRLVALGMLLGMLTFGQAKQEYSARGTVKNTQTGEPVQYALVSIAKMPTESQINDPFRRVHSIRVFRRVDLLRNPVVTIPTDAPPRSIEINYTPGGGNLQATFRDHVLPFDAVLLVPDFPAANGPELQKVKAKGVFGILGSQDTFQFANLTPGDYTIYSFPKFQHVEFRKPAFLQALSGGIRVHIEDGEIAELAITGTSTSTVRGVPFH
jgi:hypothetical protein